MPEFTNISDLARHIAGTQFLSNDQIENSLIEAAKLMESIIQDEIVDYYRSYAPKVYIRTYDWIRSIRVSKPTLNGSTMSIRVYFDESQAYHPSVISDTYSDGYVITLMDQGWHWNSSKQPRIDRFSDFNGIHYIEKSIKEFNSQNKWGFIVTVETGYGANYL